MSKIEANIGIITQIKVFTVGAENKEPLIALLIEAANSVRDVEGWISANIHVSLDGKQVVNYAQCESYAAWETVMQKLIAGGFLERNKTLATAHPALYEVVYTLEK
ncbi:MAG: antibiotic biosynthesis monooxygenase [Actinomycetota bacterium]